MKLQIDYRNDCVYSSLLQVCENYRHRHHHSWGIFNSQLLSLYVEIFVSLPDDLFFLFAT